MISKEEAREMGRDDMLRKIPGPTRTSQNFADQFAGIEHQISLLMTQRRELREDWVKYMCPLKIGDTLIGNDYSFEGRQFVVEEIGITDSWTHAVESKYKWKWVAVGPILNKNGTVGKNYTKRTVVVEDIKVKEGY